MEVLFGLLFLLGFPIATVVLAVQLSKARKTAAQAQQRVLTETGEAESIKGTLTRNIEGKDQELALQKKKNEDLDLVSEGLRLKVAKLETDLKPFQGVIDLDAKTRQLQQQEREAFASVQGLQQQIEDLKKELNPLELDSYAREFGLYEPKYDFDTSVRYKLELDSLRADQKQALKDGRAFHAPQNWTVGGSAAAGRKMVKEISQLQLRAFNGECDGLILRVRFDNVKKIEERIIDLHRKINVLDGETGCFITNTYLEMKLKELYLVHEYQEKKYLEAEEQRAIREQMREEEKAQRELEKAMADAEREEQRYQAALEKARREAESAVGVKQAALQTEIERLTAALNEAHARGERALSMAQQTRVGHVYVISNIGSFGENVYKIGMTRRLEPMERVRELGNASVPFNFDVHAVIYSEDAPKLEADLHRAFNARRVNQVNFRKEFFNVSLEEIRDFVVKNHGEIEFTQAAEAADYRKSQQAHQA